ncbi:MAG: hypothetical protein PVF89_02680 [Lysobacterales bacterium]|jgi:hypothetical protein
MDAKKIVRLVALIVAIVAAFISVPYAALILVLLGLINGFIGVPEERRQIYMVTAITLSIVAGSLGPIPAIGDYLTAILTNISTVLNAGAVAVIVMIIKDRLTE